MPASCATIVGYQQTGRIVVRRTIPLEGLGEEGDLVHDAAYWKKHDVIRIHLRVYDERGAVIKMMAHSLDDDGRVYESTELAFDGLELKTLAGARRAIAHLPRGHQGAPPSFRRALVELLLRRHARGDTTHQVAEAVGVPHPTLCRWWAAVRKEDARTKSGHQKEWRLRVPTPREPEPERRRRRR